jgi:membrane protein implicated in regulation of membrane protease activity
MLWWLWVLVGLALLAVELIAPGGFVAVFFGVSAILVGVATATTAALAEAIWLQWILFSCVALAALVLLRKPLQARLNLGGAAATPMDSFVGEPATVTEAVVANGAGRVELRGTTWMARSKTGAALAAGSRCRVEAIEGLTVWIKAD